MPALYYSQGICLQNQIVRNFVHQQIESNYNKDCLFDAFMCFEDDCKSCLPQNHKDCVLQKISYLTNKVEQNSSLKAKIQKRISEIQEQLIKQLRQSRQRLIDQLEEKGNQEGQKLIDSIFDKKSIKGLTGATMSSLFQQLSSSKNLLNQQVQKLKKEGEKMVSKFMRLREEIFGSSIKEAKIQIQSKILNATQKNYLLKQLKNPTKLLFRASQHNFSATQFHKYCDGISDTVTIVRNEFGKTMAAYTPLKWSSLIYGSVSDDSLSSFLLELDKKQKLTLTSPENAIVNGPNWGPIFGGGGFNCDLCISDQCNKNQRSYSYFPHSYKYVGKYHQNKNIFTLPQVDCSRCNFRVVEYEVFALNKE